MVDLDLAELSAQGPATVKTVEPCPPIDPRTPLRDPGRVVTGTFHHRNAAVLNLTVEGLSEPIGVTPNHL